MVFRVTHQTGAQRRYNGPVPKEVEAEPAAAAMPTPGFSYAAAAKHATLSAAIPAATSAAASDEATRTAPRVGA